MAKKKTSPGKVAAGISAGLAAAGAAAASYYFYGSTQAKKHRKIVAKWANDMKNEVIREAKRLDEINPRDFARVVDTITDTYHGARSIDAADLKRAANELKSNWKMVRREIQQASRTNVSHAKAVGKRALVRGKKTVKKIVKKASAKRTSR